jgi:uncharacterized protein
VATVGSRTPTGAGIGLTLPHIAEIVATRPSVGWLEVHPENFLANPHAMELLTELATNYPISVHTVGVSIGSASGIDRKHLKRIRGLVDRIDPFLVSGHLAWSTHLNEYLNDLLPLPFTEEALNLVADHIREVQDILGRQYLVENPSSYVAFQASTMTEAEFLGELVTKTECALLCDVSNIHLSAHNMTYDASAYIDSLPAHAIGEFHLGGFTPQAHEMDPAGEVWIDTHAAPVADGAWDLFGYAIRRIGARPALIEWDNEIPPLATLLEQAARAEEIVADMTAPEIPCARAR